MILGFRPRPASLTVPPCSPPDQRQHSLMLSAALLLAAATHVFSVPLVRSGLNTPAPPALHIATTPQSVLTGPASGQTCSSNRRGALEGMCQPRPHPWRMRPSAWGQVFGSVAVVGRYFGRFKSVWLKLRRSGKGQSGRTAGEKGACGNAVGPGAEARTCRFSRTATITGSFVALSRCCDKGGDECRGGIGHHKPGPDEGVRRGGRRICL